MPEQGFRAVLLFGVPGSGKGTQGKILSRIPGFFHLSSGDIFRSLDTNSPEGEEVALYTSRGELVPDELTIRIWKKALDAFIAVSAYKPQEDLLLLDGIPRNLNQAKLVGDYVDVLRVVYLVCSDKSAIIDRMKRRALLENRADDADEDVIRRRFEVYRNESEPILDYYSDDLISRVEALGTPAEVLRSILDCLIPLQNDYVATN
jgi:adenylate kinase